MRGSLSRGGPSSGDVGGSGDSSSERVEVHDGSGGGGDDSSSGGDGGGNIDGSTG